MGAPAQEQQLGFAEWVILEVKGHPAGLTQQALADATGLARSSIANLEAGRQDVPLSKLQALAEAVGARLVLAPNDAAEGSP